MATAICRRAFSRLSLALLVGLTGVAWAGQIGLTLESIRHPAFEADGMTVRLDTARRGEADIRFERLMAAGIEYRNLELHCSGFLVDTQRIDCPRGEIRRSDQRGADRPALPFAFSYRHADGRLELAIAGADATAWSPLVKRLRGWKPAGTTDLRLTADRREARLSVKVNGVSFAGKNGEAAERLDLALDADARRTERGWDWRAKLDWTGGRLTLPPWSRPAGVRAEARGTLDAKELAVDLARLDIAGIGAATASLGWDRALGEVVRWGFVTEPLDLSHALIEWVQPWLDTHGVPKVAATGVVRFAGDWSLAGGLKSFYAGIENADFVDASGDFALQGFDLRIPWERDAATEALLNADGGRLGELPLGGFDIPIRIEGERLAIERLEVPMLDGRLFIDALQAERRDKAWRGRFSGGIEGVSMPKLTQALKLPRMAGTLTARVPDADYADGRLALGGGLAIEAFDGRIDVRRLQVVNPFMPGQRFLLDVEARNLDLGMLTRTFAFGSIEGRFDADLKGLEMRGGKPVRFAARIASSPGDHLRLLSLGALQDIAAMGEDGKAALGKVPERAIGGFGYGRIAIGCTLADGVCLLDGIESRDGGVLLMEGSGIPAVSIVGYNRRIDWEALVKRIREVIAGKPGVLIE